MTETTTDPAPDGEREERSTPAADQAPAPGRSVSEHSGRSIAALAGRTSAGVVIVAIAAAVAIGSTFLSPPSIDLTTRDAIAVMPVPADQELVCPGGLLRLSEPSGAGVGVPSSIGAPALAWSAEAAISERGVETTNADGATARIGTVAAPSGADRVPAASGLQQQLGSDGLRGLATAACTPSGTDSWLVAGATTVGRTSLLVVTNPSAVEAQVSIEVYGSVGPVVVSGPRNLRLAPEEQRVIPLNGLVVDLEAPVVHVTSTGGRVSAAIEQSITRILDPGGVDWSGGQQPSGTLVIPGVEVADAASLAAIDVSETDHADVTPVVRLLAPLAGEGPAEGAADGAADGTAESVAPASSTGPITATIAWIPSGATLADALAARDAAGPAEGDEPGHSASGDGTPGDGASQHDGRPGVDEGAQAPAAPLPRSMDVQLTPGQTLELPVEGLPAGSYTVMVVAAAPIVGAVRTSVVAAGPESAAGTEGAPDAGPGSTAGLAAAPAADFAWSQPAAPLAEEAFAGVPRGRGAGELVSTLWVVNPTDAEATVAAAMPGAVDQMLRLAPGTAGSILLVPGAALHLQGTAGLVAAITTRGAGLLAQSPLAPPSPAASQVRVHVAD